MPYLQYEADDELSLQRENMLKNAYLGLNLDTNYRSGKTIVEFNNTLFQFVSSNWIPESQKEVYKGFVQKVKNKDKASSVDIYLLEKPKESRKKEDYTALYLDKTKEIILHCKSQGFAYKEMAVLARNNKILNALAEFLISEDIPVVSSESLFVASSPTVQFILSLLRYVSYPKEGIYQSEIIKYLLDNEKIYGADMHQLSAFLLENRAEEELQYLWASLEVQLDIKTLQSLDAYELVEFLTQTFVNHSDYKLDVPEEFDAVKLMSFHKAKGLEFPVVINWFSQSQMAKPKNLPTMIWVNPQLATVPELKSFPFNVNKLKGTQLEEKYTQEIDLDHLDMLNLFYVANTRPTEKLFLLVDQYEAPKPSSKPKVSSDFRFDKMMHDFVLEAKLEIQEEGNYHFGEEISHRNDNGSEKQMGEALDIEICASESWKKNIAFSIDNSQEQLWAHAVEWGIKVHAILSEISTIDDVEKLKHHWVIKYHLNKEDLQWITQILYQIVEHPLLKPYYQAGVEVYNEKDIFGPKNGKKGVQRVDRMAITQDYCAIIDYKTGAPNQKDQQQVKDYKNIVSQIIPQKVKGFLVYLYEEIVVEDV
ncbi:MAG: hypothetical protein B7C24_01180 [Bacteroidetes bacterium 4572_77]|nr:MAG: hypothetical protein B7C24_01180 [Bacteroidetes bacterium 4572_77]